MINGSQCSAVERNPAKVSGAWLFKGAAKPQRASAMKVLVDQSAVL
jgi:hypothetical protein